MALPTCKANGVPVKPIPFAPRFTITKDDIGTHGVLNGVVVSIPAEDGGCMVNRQDFKLVSGANRSMLMAELDGVYLYVSGTKIILTRNKGIRNSFR